MEIDHRDFITEDDLDILVNVINQQQDKLSHLTHVNSDQVNYIAELECALYDMNIELEAARRFAVHTEDLNAMLSSQINQLKGYPDKETDKNSNDHLTYQKESNDKFLIQKREYDLLKEKYEYQNSYLADLISQLNQKSQEVLSLREQLDTFKRNSSLHDCDRNTSLESELINFSINEIDVLIHDKTMKTSKDPHSSKDLDRILDMNIEPKKFTKVKSITEKYKNGYTEESHIALTPVKALLNHQKLPESWKKAIRL